jgi:hypothetical protein
MQEDFGLSSKIGNSSSFGGSTGSEKGNSSSPGGKTSSENGNSGLLKESFVVVRAIRG